MKKLKARIATLFLLLFLTPWNLSAQSLHAIVDSNVIHDWVRLGRNDDVTISNDGKYFSYMLEKGFYAEHLVIQSTSDTWKAEFPNGKVGRFSADSRKYVFMTGDSVAILTLGTGAIEYISGVVPYSIKEPKAIKGYSMVFPLEKPGNEVVFLNLLTSSQQRFKGISGFQISDDGTALLLKTDSKENDTTTAIDLRLVEVTTGHVTSVWKSSNPNMNLTGFAIDKAGQQVALAIGEKKNGRFNNTIWYWKHGMAQTVMKINSDNAAIAPGLQILPGMSFSDNGDFIYFALQPIYPTPPAEDPISVDVWCATDTMLQSTQLQKIQFFNPYTPPFGYVFNIAENRIIPLTGICDYRQTYRMQTGNQDYVIVTHNCKGDRFWSNHPDSNWLVSLKDGSKTLLNTKGEWTSFWFVPNSKYLLYYDRGRGGHYFSYNLQNGKEIKISASIPDGGLTFEPEDNPPTHEMPPAMISSVESVGVAGFLNDGRTVFVYDNYDIWKLDLNGTTPPINITNGYGRSHHIKFRILSQDSRDFNTPPPIFNLSQPQILTAFNEITQYNGFYQATLSARNDPKELFMGPYYIYCGQSVHITFETDFSSNFRPLKAADAYRWIVQRESTNEAPNYFLTTDFKNFQTLTHLQSQKEYDLPTAELVHFTRSDGIKTQGVLYKPRNFDSSWKYPVIFNIYRMFSQRLYQFPQPHFNDDAHINIPWFTSRGYLVFTPDIYDNFVGQNGGKSSLLTVEAAVKELAKRRYIDSRHLGLTGHSTAGGRVAYIISHCNLFAAAFEGAGNTDWISSSLEIAFSGISRLQGNEQAFGSSIWNKKDIYLDNPVLNADKIVTPLLIFHCKGDPGVLFEQGLELFLALRRLDKTAWMLQYDRGDHSVRDKAAEDLSTRITQYFDHYLKGKPKPIWMAHGIPARLKGIEYGYELENNNEHR